MPVFEHVYEGQGLNQDGLQVQVPPRLCLQKMGPSLQVTISPTQQHISSLIESGKNAPEPISGVALIDTGATVTAVDESICQRLNIPPTGTMPISHAGGTGQTACYPIAMTFPGTGIPTLQSMRAVSVNLSDGSSPHILLVGRDILANLKMVYNGPMGRIEIAF